MTKSKVLSLEEAAALVRDGDTLSLGGNVLHRSPLAFCRELIRQNRRGLKLVKTAGAHDVDILCSAGAVASVDAGFIGYETEYGLAMHYRKAVEGGLVKANEHACYTVICALRASQYGVPFMPVRGLMYGDLIEKNDYFKVIEDPFSGEKITVVKALRPDYAILHVQEADEYGNARIVGPKYEDVLLSRSAKKVIITCERLIHTDNFARQPELTDIPGFLVEAVVLAPNGAAPGTCAGRYDLDRKSLDEFKGLKTKEQIIDYVDKYSRKDRGVSRF